jgi:predicted nucleic acid-binding protein
MSIYVLDTFALLAYFNAEPGGMQIKDLIRSASAKQATLYLSQINMGELYYIVFRRRGIQKAQETLQTLRELPVIFCEATETRILAAAELKAQYPISYADSFAAALAIERSATLVSGDPEFSALTPEITMLWIAQA